MNTRFVLMLLSCAGILQSCSPVKVPVTNKYQLTAYSAREISKNHHRMSILVSLPDAAASYQTEQMLYMDKPFRLQAFAYNAWASAPANMLYPLLIQSLQHSGYFYAVASSPYAEQTEYRLDTQLLKLHQDFLTRPSHIELVVKVVLARVSDNRVLASGIITEKVPCSMGSPYGGVLAANRATETLTAGVTDFVIRAIKRRKA